MLSGGRRSALPPDLEDPPRDEANLTGIQTSNNQFRQAGTANCPGRRRSRREYMDAAVNGRYGKHTSSTRLANDVIVFCHLRFALPAFKGQRWVRLERGRIGMRCDTVKEQRRTPASQVNDQYKRSRLVSRVI